MRLGDLLPETENISGVGFVVLALSSRGRETIRTCRGPITLAERATNKLPADWVDVRFPLFSRNEDHGAACCGRPLHEVYRCARCRSLCCCCNGGTESEVCDDCMAELGDLIRGESINQRMVTLHAMRFGELEPWQAEIIDRNDKLAAGVKLVLRGIGDEAWWVRSIPVSDDPFWTDYLIPFWHSGRWPCQAKSDQESKD